MTTWTKQDEARYQQEEAAAKAQEAIEARWTATLREIGESNADAALNDGDGMDDPVGSYADNCDDTVCSLGSNEPWDCTWTLSDQKDVAYEAFRKVIDQAS